MRSGVQNSDNNRENRINTSINNQKCSDKYKNVQTSTKMFRQVQKCSLDRL